MAATEAVRQPRTYGNWRRPQSAGILGLGTAGTAVLLGGLVFTVLVVMVSDIWHGLLAFMLVAVFVVLVSLRDRHGRNLMERLGSRIGYVRARQAGRTLYRSGPLGVVPWGTAQLPGLAAQLKLSQWRDSYGREFALIEDPHARTYAVVIATDPDGAALVDEAQVDQWVASWGHWIANLADEPALQAAAVIVETAPDTGARLRREVRGQVDPNAPTFAQAMLSEIVERYPAGSSTVRAFVTLTFSAYGSATGKKRTPEEMSRDLASRLPNLTASLQGTGAGVTRLVDSRELCEVLRVAYDPAAQATLEEVHAQDGEADLDFANCGPVASEAGWDVYRHDSGVSQSWTMSVAPRGAVQSSVLVRLLQPHAEIARKRVALLYRPISSARAAAIVEADLNAARFRATSTDRPTARMSLETRAAQQAATEEASGAGLTNFAIVVTATVWDTEQLADARATVDNLAAASRLTMRPAYGAQEAAFMSALPLGLVLPKHVRVAELRKAL